MVDAVARRYGMAPHQLLAVNQLDLSLDVYTYFTVAEESFKNFKRRNRDMRAMASRGEEPSVAGLISDLIRLLE